MKAGLLASVALLLMSAVAVAQNQPMFATGTPLTPGHVPVFAPVGTPGGAVTRDGGPAIAGNLTELGITNDGLPQCIRDKAQKHIMCFGANVNGQGMITYNPIGGGADQPLVWNFNGTNYAFPFTGPGSGIIGPDSTTPGDYVCWNNPTGTLAADCNLGTLTPNAAVCDGSTDDAAALQSTLNTLVARGGGIMSLPPGKVCAIGTTLAISTSNIGINCPSGGGILVTSPVPTTGCWLKWIGANGGEMLSIISPVGTTTTQPIQGVYVGGINFDGNNGLADTAIDIQTLFNSRFVNLFAQNFRAGAKGAVYSVDVNHNVTAGNFGSVCDTQGNVFTNLRLSNYGFADSGLYLGNYINNTIPNGGCNAGLNLIQNIQFNIGSGQVGIVHDGDDNNLIIQATVATVDGTGYFDEYRIQHQTDATKCSGNGCYGPSNNNITMHYSSNARGNPGSPAGSSYLHGQGAGFGSWTGCLNDFGTQPGSCVYGIQLLYADTGNNTAKPGIETGAMVSGYSNTFGQQWFCAQPTLDAECFGAAGDDTTDDTAAIKAWISAYLNFGQNRTGPMHLSSKSYKVTSEIDIDPGSTGTYLSDGIKLYSDGAALDGSTITGTTTFSIICTGHTNCDATIRGGLTVKGANPGPVAYLGRPDLTDSWNGMDIDWLTPQNASTNTLASGIQINNVSNSHVVVKGAFQAGSGGATGAGIFIHGSAANNNDLKFFGTNWAAGSTQLLIDGTGVQGNTIGVYGTGLAGTCVTASNAGVMNNTFMPFNCGNTQTDYNFTAGSGNVLVNPIYGTVAHGSAVGLTKMSTTAVP